MDGVGRHFHSDRCYVMGPGDTEVLACGMEGPSVIVECDDDIPVETRRELMHCATRNGRISYGYLCDLWRRGRCAGMGGFDFRAHLQRQREFSERTFGPGRRTKGVIQHIRKELKEVAENPADISEWIDVTILALDGAWRAGFSPDQIIAALAAKQAKNEARQWPDWRTMDPEAAIEHTRE
jgi:hypothetical protein